jgi:hypothetical protein
MALVQGDRIHVQVIISSLYDPVINSTCKLCILDLCKGTVTPVTLPAPVIRVDEEVEPIEHILSAFNISTV